MIKKLQVYKCGVCGNIVEVLHVGGGVLVCCGQPMKLQEENTVDASQEKHVPVIAKTPEGIEVTIGSVIHPSTEEHHIEWIQIIAGDKAYRQFLSPGQVPKAVFAVEADDVTAREYCNLHGLWSKK